MSRRVYTQEQIDYIRSIAKGRYNDEITEMFNKKFNTNKTVDQIRSLKSNYKIKSGKRPKRRSKHSLFTPEQEDYIRKIAPGKFNQEIADMVNKKYGLNITRQQINTWKANHNVTSGLTGYFPKGHVPWNKGKKGINTGGEAGWFKKGQKPKNYRPVGSERIDSKDGYVLIKVQDEGTYPERWKHKHVVIWEKANGKVPDDHVVVFLDGDKQNIILENLALLTKAEVLRMNQNNLFSDDPELTLAGIALVRLNAKVYDANLLGNNKESLKTYKERAERNGISEHTFIQRLKRGWPVEDAVNRPLFYRLKERRVD